MARLARWCFGHRAIVIVGWLVALALLAGINGAGGSAYSDSFSLPGTESTRALELLQRSFKAQSGDSDTIVVHTTSGTVRDPAVRARVSAMLARVARVPHVVSVVSPYSPGGAQISRDGRTAYATVSFDGQPQDVPKSAYQRVIAIAEAARTGGLRVELGGAGIQQAEQQPPSSSEGIGILAAAIVLFIAFGSLPAMLLPLLTTIVALGAALSANGLLAHVFTIATFAPTLAALIGLGVGVDYALFIITRHRNAIKAGGTPVEAAELALNTSGRAVLFAGGTVCVALLGLLVLGVSFLNGVAIAAAATVLFTVAAAVTLLPALLGVIGVRVLSRRERRRLEAEGGHDPHDEGFWARWAAFVQRHPLPLAAGATVAMLVLAIPFLSLRLGSADAGNDPASSTTRQAYDLLAEGFGPGFNGPLQLAARTPRRAADQPVLRRLGDAVRRTPGVASVTPPVFNPEKTVAVIQVVPTTAPQAIGTSQLITRLRNQVVPAATRSSDVTVYVGGITAIFDDFADVLTGKLPLFIAVIVGLGCILLLVAFRSLLVPAVAACMNLLAAGAAFGVVTAVFQKGWGAQLIGAGKPGPVEAFLPVMMLAILFGLSMDYQVFLVSRMHEEWTRTRDNGTAVRVGQADTGRVITAAAAIMILVFGSFVLGGQRIIAEFGIGLASAVLLDAFLLRTILVPAVMHLIGPANWWLPRWLDRIVPHVSVDPAEAEVAAAGDGRVAGDEQVDDERAA
ncbi:MAG: putative drug exporter of the superfamily [Solirubrobacteraceae bacterium]|nr:putative drug exporter of the superfamily [Solirubrobacteraceae bacterium]